MKYYAVKKGQRPGIYTTWDSCQKQVIGYSGAEYKSFKSLDEAKAWLGGIKQPQQPQQRLSPKQQTFKHQQQLQSSSSAGEAQAADKGPELQAVLYSDGASRNNPGLASIGGWLEMSSIEAFSYRRYLGKCTSVEAEYVALLEGLALALHAGVTHITCKLDSQLVVGHVTGSMQCNADHLKGLCEIAQTMLKQFATSSLVHIPREYNKRADELANDALDSSADHRDKFYKHSKAPPIAESYVFPFF